MIKFEPTHENLSLCRRIELNAFLLALLFTRAALTSELTVQTVKISIKLPVLLNQH